jgi:hypothetical protein
MAGRVTSDLLLVGSLPADSSEQALRSGAELFGDLVFALPDGETGPRAAWVGYEANGMIRPHPDVATSDPPDAENGVPRYAHQFAASRPRDGVSELRWDSWPRIEDALASYRLFTELREQGAIPEHLRFQIGLPFPASALAAFVKSGSADAYRIAEQAYEDLVARELDRLTAEIPPADLAIQWDVCFEVLDLEGVLSWAPDGAWERFTGPAGRLGRLVPDEVLMGYHFCYGTFPDWPMYEARDMSLIARMANYAVANAGRPVDWLHLAGPRSLRSEEDRFFQPLTDLEVDDARVFLGIVLPVDGAAGLRRRHATAKKYLKEFGVAMYCGFGRQRGRDGVQTLRDHRHTVVALHS